MMLGSPWPDLGEVQPRAGLWHEEQTYLWGFLLGSSDAHSLSLEHFRDKWVHLTV